MSGGGVVHCSISVIAVGDSLPPEVANFQAVLIFRRSGEKAAGVALQQRKQLTGLTAAFLVAQDEIVVRVQGTVVTASNALSVALLPHCLLH